MSSSDTPSAGPTVLAVGECMVELRHVSARLAELGVAGDTYNTAVYLLRTSRWLGNPLSVGYLTGLGGDAYSDQIRVTWAAESVADRSIRLDDRFPGLYAVRTDDDGERSFSYWRHDSAAAVLFRGIDWIDAVRADHVHFSGISLQLMTQRSLDAFLQRLTELRAQGTTVSFDTNYRPAGWSTPDRADRQDPVARAAFDDAARCADIVFASLDDEQLLRGITGSTTVAALYRRLGASEVVVKLGARGALLAHGAERHHHGPVEAVPVVDTTAAGDGFAGGYLAGRLTGQPPDAAMRLGAAVAAQVIQWPGAIVPDDAFVPSLP